MHGDPEIIDLLNDVLTAELTAINQYFIHAKMCENWGYDRLAAHGRDESIDEMKHADDRDRPDPLLRRRPQHAAAVPGARRRDGRRAAAARPRARVRRRRAPQQRHRRVPSPRATTAPASCWPRSSCPRRSTSTGSRRSRRRSARSASSSTSPSSCTTDVAARSRVGCRPRVPACHDGRPGDDRIPQRGAITWRSASPSTARRTPTTSSRARCSSTTSANRSG